MSPHRLTATEATNALRSGALDPVALGAHMRARIGQCDAQINAFAHVNRCDPTDEAKRRPLAGLPITVKDQIHVAGMPCTSGLDALRGFVPAAHAPVVEQLVAAGAHVLGKTCLPPLAMDFQTNQTLWGTTNNPWNPALTAGGSSGGGAAAVAAGLSFADIGADLAGSLRIPAAFCGVCSLLPSEKALPTEGSMTLVERAGLRIEYLPRVGPIARTVADLRLIWSALTNSGGSAPRAPTSLRIAASLAPSGAMVDRAMLSVIQSALERLQEGGARVEHTQPKLLDWPSVWRAYGQIQGYQFAAMTPLIQRLAMRVLGRRSRQRSPTFVAACQEGYRRRRADYAAALDARAEAIEAVDSLFNDFDVWMLPVALVPAFPHVAPSAVHGFMRDYDHDFLVDNRPVNYFEALTRFTTLFNLTGHPVVTLPVGLLPGSGLPVGVQLAGRRDGEAELLSTADCIQQELGILRCPVLDAD